MSVNSPFGIILIMHLMLAALLFSSRNRNAAIAADLEIIADDDIFFRILDVCDFARLTRTFRS
jgi:hypothetical protein